jgi:hypothetical protein
MPTATYIALGNLTLASATSTMSFSNIPATYRDLILVTNVTHSATNEIELAIRFNSDSGNNYNRISMTGNASTAVSFAEFNQNYLYVLAASTTVSVGLIEIMDYSVTNKHKSVLSRGNLSSGRVSATHNRWASTAALNQISVSCLSGNFNSGSTFSLYGVSA